MKIIKSYWIILHLTSHGSSKPGCIYSQRQSRSIIYHGIILRIFSNVTLNLTAVYETDRPPLGMYARSWRTSMNSERRAKIQFVSRRIVLAARFRGKLNSGLKNTTARENKWLSRFGSRLINRSQLPPPHPFPFSLLSLSLSFLCTCLLYTSAPVYAVYCAGIRDRILFHELNAKDKAMFSFLSSYVGRDVESAACRGIYYAQSFDLSTGKRSSYS